MKKASRITAALPAAFTLAGLLTISAATAQAQAFKSQYMVIDLSGGPKAKKYPVSYETKPPDLDFDTCRTKELWLRLIPAGTFMMGSPDNELGRETGVGSGLIGNETLHQVTLTQPFYIGVFEVTQRQYELVMGTNPSQHKGNTRPVEQVSYDDLRGKEKGKQWPENNDVDDTSFFGVLRAKTGLLADLPTEAQWEYACRAGTTTALNSGKNLTDKDKCQNAAEVGRYGNDGKGKFVEHTKVGMYKPNAWGLYDMHGNVWEFCLDWPIGNLGTLPVTDPKGAESGSRPVVRGGGAYLVNHFRSATRCWWFGSDRTHPNHGFRMVVLPSAGQVKPVTPAATPTATAALGDAEEELAEACAEFKAIWDVYKTNAEKIAAEFQPRSEALQQQYQKALETLKGNVQRRGDLDKAEAVVAEMKQFEETKTLPPEPDKDAIAEIKAIQTNALKPFTALEKDRLTRMTTLTKRYGQALEQLQSDLVKAGKLEDAAAVRKAREQAKRAE